MTIRESIKKYIEINNIRYNGDYSELDLYLQDADIEPIVDEQRDTINVDIRCIGNNIDIQSEAYNYNYLTTLHRADSFYYFFTFDIAFDSTSEHITRFSLQFNAIDSNTWSYINPNWVDFHAVGVFTRLSDMQSVNIDIDYYDGEVIDLVPPQTSIIRPGCWTDYLDGEQHITMRISDGNSFNIFKDVNSAIAYYRDGDADGFLNADSYATKKFEYFIKNTVYKNGTLLYYRDYKFKTDSQTDPHCMALVRNDSVGYDHILNGQNSNHITQILSRGRSDRANEYAPTSSAPTEYLRYSQETAGGNDYTVSFWRTNIHCFDNQNDANDYISTGNTENSTNNQDVNRANNTIVDGHIGDVVTQTDNGTSGISFAYGGQIYALSSVNLASFFTNVLFSTDTDIKNALLEGLQLFGANQINAINGCMYLPISDISDIASVSSVNKCFIGTYEAPITAQRVVANDKMINCGSAVFEPAYGDVRDFEPYCKLYVMLPYCGTHELTISKYIGKTVSLKYAVDVTTGACTAYLYANNVIMDSFDGTMGVQRPITAVNQQAQVSSIINGIMGTAESVSKTVGTAGMAIAGGSALSSATTGAKAISASGEIANAGTNFGGGVQGTILQGYNALQASLDAPMSTRGAFSGILGQFGNQYPYFIFAWLKTSKPANEIETVGLPSNAGGAVGNFGGFLQCSAFNLANGFGGTDAEANEIYSIMSSGVYVS